MCGRLCVAEMETALGRPLFYAWAGDREIHFDDHLPGYSFVHLLPDEKTIVHHHTFTRPEASQ